MALDRWIALILLGFSLTYGYTAWFTMDADLAPFMQQAVLMLALMVTYALVLRPLGFLISTFSFLVLGSAFLGERKWFVMVLVGAIATLVVWYLVQVVLGIYLRPLPGFLGG